jgi:hypothetical protein
MEVGAMTMRRTITALATMPVLLGVLGAAASTPALTFHGVFDSYTLADTGGCHLPSPPAPTTGVWNVQVPDPNGRSGLAELMIQVGGRMAVVGNVKPLALQGPVTDSSFDTLWTNGRPADDPGFLSLAFTLDGEQFTYEVTHSGCVITFVGHETR